MRRSYTGAYSPPSVDRISGIWGSYYKMAKAIFYLVKGDYTGVGLFKDWGLGPGLVLSD